MPKEMRRIVFAEHEVTMAMVEYRLRQGAPLGNGQTGKIDFDPERLPAMVMTRRLDNGQSEVTEFTLQDAAAALILFCKSYKIPLPRDCKKSLVRHDGLPTYSIVHNWQLLSQFHVMVIDDQEIVRNIVGKFLKQGNIERITEARNGAEALYLLSSDKCAPDVIICDLHMEQVDGIEMVKRLRADVANPNRNKPILMLTGDSDTRVHQEALNAGATRVLTKPIAADALLTAVFGAASAH
jgi:two-component system chemotaxis response regulator CheY